MPFRAPSRLPSKTDVLLAEPVTVPFPRLFLCHGHICHRRIHGYHPAFYGLCDDLRGIDLHTESSHGYQYHGIAGVTGDRASNRI